MTEIYQARSREILNFPPECFHIYDALQIVDCTFSQTRLETNVIRNVCVRHERPNTHLRWQVIQNVILLVCFSHQMLLRVEMTDDLR